jgi:hypothetical protein
MWGLQRFPSFQKFHFWHLNRLNSSGNDRIQKMKEIRDSKCGERH